MLNKGKNEKEDREKFINLEKKIENLEIKINKYKFAQLIESIAILTEKEKDTKIYESINNLEWQINDINQKLNKQEKDTNTYESINNLKSQINDIFQKLNKQEKEINIDNFSKIKSNDNDQEIMDKIISQDNIILTIQSQLKNLQEEKTNENISQNNMEKTLADIIKKNKWFWRKNRIIIYNNKKIYRMKIMN